MLSESARAASAAEARYRIDAPNSRQRAVKVIALDPPELVLSAVRRSARDTLIARFYNISREVIEGTITCGLPVTAAYCVGLNEERQGERTRWLHM